MLLWYTVKPYIFRLYFYVFLFVLLFCPSSNCLRRRWVKTLSSIYWASSRVVVLMIRGAHLNQLSPRINQKAMKNSSKKPVWFLHKSHLVIWRVHLISISNMHFSHLMFCIWQWNCHYPFQQIKSVMIGTQTPNVCMRGKCCTKWVTGVVKNTFVIIFS